MSHTPGPWTALPPRPIHGEWLQWVCAIDSKGEAYANIARIPLPHQPESQANARLIAAAPELLAALKLARQYVGATYGVLAGAAGPNNLVSHDLDVIDTAIAKAEDCS